MYGDVPPVALTVAVPFVALLHVKFTCDCNEGVTPILAATVTVVVVVHPFASVTVHVYVPAANPVAFAFVPPEGVQLYVNVPVPPVPLAVAVPLLKPQFVFTKVDVAVSAGGLVSVTTCVVVHPFASVT